MSKEETLKRHLATELKLAYHRIEEIKKWQARLDLLSSRDKKPLGEIDFCKKYKFAPGYFNGVKLFKKSCKQQYFHKVEKALRKEGV